MRKSKITFETATKAHITEFYGDQSLKSLKGHVALLDGRVVGVGGLGFEKGHMVLFSDISDEMRPFKKYIVKAVRVLGQIVEDVKYPITAVADRREALSEKLLTGMGFIFTGLLTDNGDKVFRREP